MNFLKSLVTAAAATLILGAGAATAQTTAPAAKPTAAAPATAKPAKAKVSKAKAPKARSAESIACSAEADAKGLKGKDRKKFRNACLKKAKAAAKAPKKAS